MDSRNKKDKQEQMHVKVQGVAKAQGRRKIETHNAMTVWCAPTKQ